MAHLFVSYYLKGMQSFMGRDDLVVELLGVMSLFAVKCQQTTTKQKFFVTQCVTDTPRYYAVCDGHSEISRGSRYHDVRLTDC